MGAKEKALVRRLLELLQDLEIDRDAISFVLAAMRTTHPEFPAREMLEEARQYHPLRNAVLEKYMPLLEAMDWSDVDEILEQMPSSKYPN